MRWREVMRRRVPALLVLLSVSVSGLLWAATRVAPEPALYEAERVCRRFVLHGADGRIFQGQAEDLAVDQERAALVLSLYDRKRGRPGGLFTLPLGALDTEGAVLGLTPLSDDPALSRPHGVALYGDRLAVIARDAAGGAKIRVLARTETAWRPAGTLDHPRACRANDMAWLDEDMLSISIDRGACGGLGAMWEQATGAAAGSLLLWDLRAGEVREAADGLAFANGVALAAGDALVSETRAGRVRAYDAATLTRTPLPLQTYEARATPGGPDNLTTTEDGRVFAALHPNLLRLAFARYGPFAKAPGRVALIEGERVRTLLDDPRGDVIPGATVAVEVEPGLLAVGSATAPGLTVCDVRGE